MAFCIVAWQCAPISADTRVALAFRPQIVKGNPALAELIGGMEAIAQAKLGEDGSIQLIERAGVELMLRELALSGSWGDARKVLRTDALKAADFLVLGTVGKANDRQYLLMQVVEPLSGQIRGCTICFLSADSAAQSAEETAEYIASVIREPREAAVTLAVGIPQCDSPFERDQLLATGVCDLLVAGLQGGSSFRIVQRSDMTLLVRELDLIRAGMTDGNATPADLPERQAAYLLKGTYSIARDGGEPMLQLRTQLVSTATGEVVETCQTGSTTSTLGSAITKHADRMIERLRQGRGTAPSATKPRQEHSEFDYLLSLALLDTWRMWRTNPLDHSPYHFELRDRRMRGSLPAVDLETPLGLQVLRQTIDRLECALFLRPDDTVATYALAYCLGLSGPETYNPARASELLGAVILRDSGELRQAALFSRPLIHYRPRNPGSTPMDAPAAAAAYESILQDVTAQERPDKWDKCASAAIRLYLQIRDYPAAIRCIRAVGDIAACRGDDWCDRHQHILWNVAIVVGGMNRAPVENLAEVRQLMEQWHAHRTAWLRFTGAFGLASIARAEGDLEGWARWINTAAGEEGVPLGKRRAALLAAARRHNADSQPQAALSVLQAMDLHNEPNLQLVGYHAMETGKAYEALGRPDEALKVYTDIASRSVSTLANSDVMKRIERLGGLKSDPDPILGVRIVSDDAGMTVNAKHLAVGGNILYCGGIGVKRYDLVRNQWLPPFKTGFVRDLSADEGCCWVGTQDDGVWRLDFQGNQHRHWTEKEGLPDNQVFRLAHDGATAFALVGRHGSAGLIRIDPDGTVHGYDDPNAPRSPIKCLLVSPEAIWAGAAKLDRATNQWQRIKSVALFPGRDQLWGIYSRGGIYPFTAPGAGPDNRFESSWGPVGSAPNRHLYSVNFLVERDRHVWFGGSTCQKYLCVGLYSVDKQNGAFRMYGASDGLPHHSIMWDGVWAADRLWLTNGADLMQVDITRSEQR